MGALYSEQQAWMESRADEAAEALVFQMELELERKQQQVFETGVTIGYMQVAMEVCEGKGESRKVEAIQRKLDDLNDQVAALEGEIEDLKEALGLSAPGAEYSEVQYHKGSPCHWH